MEEQSAYALGRRDRLPGQSGAREAGQDRLQFIARLFQSGNEIIQSIVTYWQGQIRTFFSTHHVLPSQQPEGFKIKNPALNSRGHHQNLSELFSSFLRGAIRCK